MESRTSFTISTVIDLDIHVMVYGGGDRRGAGRDKDCTGRDKDCTGKDCNEDPMTGWYHGGFFKHIQLVHAVLLSPVNYSDNTLYTCVDVFDELYLTHTTKITPFNTHNTSQLCYQHLW